MTDTIETRVARGAALLDRALANWDERIDLGRLDLGSTCDCVLGQEFAASPYDSEGYSTPFDLGLNELLGADAGDAARWGFDRYGRKESYAELTAGWKRLILARRAGSEARDDR